ncbi:MAG: NUDIX hydrolase [Bacteroidaceae bacterium]|nr:NUDIX hydrolase [Bacteroidaceae bacterium]
MKDMKWKTLDREYLFRRPWLTARRDKVQLPDGRVMDDYYVLEYPTWVNVIAITQDGKMVLVRQYRHALGVTRFELCAGVVEENETPLQAAQRELLEETGFGGGTWQEYMCLSPNASTMNNLSYSFLAEGVMPMSQQHLDSTEDLEVHILTKEKVYELLKNGGLMQALMVAPLWKYFSGQSMNH